MNSGRPELIRAIGRWSLAALVINSIIGSGIFGLPSAVAKLTGTYSHFAVLFAGCAVGVIMACFAEVASHFTGAGGPYLYARTAFGRLVGIEMGWLLWLARLTGPAANANLFTSYLGEFWPDARQSIPRLVVLTLLIGGLTIVNVRGVRAGTQVSNIFTAAKLLPLVAVIVAGVSYLILHPAVVGPTTPAPGTGSWLQAVLLLIFAYGGFETALTPMGEAKDPRHDAAFGLFVALVTCTVIYTLIQWVVVRILVNPGISERPLADAAVVLMGRGGAVLIATGALVSTYGYLNANILAVPRITFALAEAGDFPSIFAAVHRRFQTPYFSILIFAALTWLFAVFASFSWNVTLSAVSRLFYYGLTCAALLVLRNRNPQGAAFRLPGGTAFAVCGILICLTLTSQIRIGGSLVIAATVAIAFFNWLAVRHRPSMRG